MRERTKPPGDRCAVRLLEPVTKRVMARQFAAYHEKLRSNLEASPP